MAKVCSAIFCYTLLKNSHFSSDIRTYRSNMFSSKFNRGHREDGRLGSLTNFKAPILKYIENSFHEVTHIGLEPTQFFPFKISQQIQSQQRSKVFAKMGRSWQAV